MAVGRHKSENSKKNVFHIRLTDEELAELENVAKKLKISKTDAVLRGIKNLSQIQPVYYRNQTEKNSETF
ncbi:MAG: hypothetical protein IK062_03865 [Selenomonadaceae bacterium]|nr:hypothetical protein [Selenomonadaceae bacterium]